jgi:hypothetical protein
VWEYVQGSRQYRILIVSNDEYNELPRGAAGSGARTRGHRDPGVPGRARRRRPAARRHGRHPRVLRCDPSALRHNLGFVTNDTIDAVERGLWEFLTLP